MQNKEPYHFIAGMNAAEVKKFLSYIKGNLMALNKKGWCVGMEDVWELGRIKAEQRLEFLQGN